MRARAVPVRIRGGVRSYLSAVYLEAKQSGPLSCVRGTMTHLPPQHGQCASGVRFARAEDKDRLAFQIVMLRHCDIATRATARPVDDRCGSIVKGRVIRVSERVLGVPDFGFLSVSYSLLSSPSR